MSPRPSPFDFDAVLRTCIHCGLCLNVCPTYRVTGDEAESPRGRLVLLREVLAPVADAAWSFDRGPLDRCLGCRACEPACPSGVPYGRLLEEGRARLPEPSSTRSRWVRRVVRDLLPHPRRLAVAARAGQGLRRLGLSSVFPEPFRGLLEALPRRRARWPRAVGRATGGRIALLTGCGQSVFTPEVVPSVVELVRAAGGEPYVPAKQSCCGALSAHEGLREEAIELARRYVRTFEGAEEVVVAAAGCSAHLRHLELLFEAGGEEAARARAVAERTHDFVPWLARRADRLRFLPDSRRVAYHPACHHLQAQGIEGLAESLLDRIPGLQRVVFPHAALCCGSAGAWSLHHPQQALARRDEKLADILGGAPDLVLTANPGCELFLHGGAGPAVEVRHLATYLAERLERPL